jgi:hypothetical protein
MSTILTGRLVDERSQPIRDRLVQIGFEARDRGSSSSPERTDAQGRFRIPLLAAQGERLDATFQAQPLGIGPGEGGRVHVPLQIPSVPAVTDLGDVVVRPAQVFVTGRTVDERGAPLPRAMFHVQASYKDVDGGAWRQDPALNTNSGSDGAFRIVGVTRPQRLRLRAQLGGRAPSDVVEVVPGARDVELVLPHACGISGRALLDVTVQPQRVRVVALRPGEAALAPEQVLLEREVRLAEDGTFGFTALPPGSYDLQFRIGNAGEPFFTLSGVEVRDGGKAVDARLDAIDLRGKVPARPAAPARKN